MAPATDKPKFLILACDGGGIRGLISALVLAEIERRLEAKPSEERRGEAPKRLADYFHLFAGTSTGGLISLALTKPEPPPADELADFYTEDGPTIFDAGIEQDLKTLWGWIGPRYSAGPLEGALRERLGPDGKLHQARRDVLVTSYDARAGEPHFFKRWKALDAIAPGAGAAADDQPLVRVARATSAAPTYFPAEKIGERILVDGGVFANDPAVAAIAEALGRRDPPGPLKPDDLFMVSVGTGEFKARETGSPAGDEGKVGWLVGKEGSPILDAMMNGAADGADYWAHMILNHEPGEAVPGRLEMGRGPRYFRLQARLPGPVAMDDTSDRTLTEVLPEAARELIADRGQQIDEIVEVLTAAGPIPPGPGGAAPGP